MSTTHVLHDGGWCVRLDLSKQVLGLDVFEWFPRSGRLSPLLPYGDDDRMVSAAALLMKAKQFDDGLYAAVELAAQKGAGRFAGKASLLAALAAALPDAADTAALVFAACQLGGVPALPPADLQDAIRAVVNDFLGEERRCKPLGFYTWAPELEGIFRQDRLLQGRLQPGTAAALRRALDEAPGARTAHDACLRLAARLTNPPARPNRSDAGTEPPFFPPSRSHEVDLLERLYGDRPIPDGFDLMGELIRRVRSGDISLRPGEGSGWYDHQAWSLEPLVVPDRMPEARHLHLRKSYRRHLLELFRGLLALARETHVGQAAGSRGGYGGSQRPIVWVQPGLTVEPLPALYLRRSACYRFVRSVLKEAFGLDALARMHRLRPEGPCDRGLADELPAMESLFNGAYLTSCQELGLEPEVTAEAAEGDAGRFAAWADKLGADVDLSEDCRMMVPVFYDVQRRRTKVWAFLGWDKVSLRVWFDRPPRVVGCEPGRPPEPEQADGRGPGGRKSGMAPEPAGPVGRPDVQFSGEEHGLVVPVMVEAYVRRLLHRHEFRRHCDRYGTREAILANLR